ncbi:hypothetical protein BJ912DRAFT_995055 [Pholiota molesta]|nr:hypothetical protein BJ912DRAFT_995055 [Pholiota molesta]
MALLSTARNLPFLPLWWVWPRLVTTVQVRDQPHGRYIYFPPESIRPDSYLMHSFRQERVITGSDQMSISGVTTPVQGSEHAPAEKCFSLKVERFFATT